MNAEERAREFREDQDNRGVDNATFDRNLAILLRTYAETRVAARDQEYREAFGLKYADGSPMLPGYMNPEHARGLLETMRTSYEIAESAARREERDAAIEIVQSEPELPGAIPAELVALVQRDPEKCLRGLVRTTKNCIGARIAARALGDSGEPPTDSERGEAGSGPRGASEVRSADPSPPRVCPYCEDGRAHNLSDCVGLRASIPVVPEHHGGVQGVDASRAQAAPSPPSREWLKRMAEAESQYPSISVGGLASDLGMLAPRPVGASGSESGGMVGNMRREGEHGARDAAPDRPEMSRSEGIPAHSPATSPSDVGGGKPGAESDPDGKPEHTAGERDALTRAATSSPETGAPPLWDYTQANYHGPAAPVANGTPPPFVVASLSELHAMGLYVGPERCPDERLDRFESHIRSVTNGDPDRRAMCDNYVLDLIADLRAERKSVVALRTRAERAEGTVAKFMSGNTWILKERDEWRTRAERAEAAVAKAVEERGQAMDFVADACGALRCLASFWQEWMKDADDLTVLSNAPITVGDIRLAMRMARGRGAALSNLEEPGK